MFCSGIVTLGVRTQEASESYRRVPKTEKHISGRFPARIARRELENPSMVAVVPAYFVKISPARGVSPISQPLGNRIC